jgi:hypothetical protein
MRAAKTLPKGNAGAEKLYRCYGVPPPPGEDASSAETKVGEAPSWVLEAMRFTAPSVPDEGPCEVQAPPASGVVPKLSAAEDRPEPVREPTRSKILWEPPPPVFNVPIARCIPVDRAQMSRAASPYARIFATNDVNREALLLIGAVLAVVIALSGAFLLFQS